MRHAGRLGLTRLDDFLTMTLGVSLAAECPIGLPGTAACPELNWGTSGPSARHTWQCGIPAAADRHASYQSSAGQWRVLGLCFWSQGHDPGKLRSPQTPEVALLLVGRSFAFTRDSSSTHWQASARLPSKPPGGQCRTGTVLGQNLLKSHRSSATLCSGSMPLKRTNSSIVRFVPSEYFAKSVSSKSVMFGMPSMYLTRRDERFAIGSLVFQKSSVKMRGALCRA